MAVPHHFVIGTPLAQHHLTARDLLQDALHGQQIMAFQQAFTLLGNDPLLPIDLGVGNVETEIH